MNPLIDYIHTAISLLPQLRLFHSSPPIAYGNGVCPPLPRIYNVLILVVYVFFIILEYKLVFYCAQAACTFYPRFSIQGETKQGHRIESNTRQHFASFATDVPMRFWTMSGLWSICWSLCCFYMPLLLPPCIINYACTHFLNPPPSLSVSLYLTLIAITETTIG